MAPVCVLNEGRHNDLPMYRVAADAAGFEKTRLRDAVEAVAKRLDVLRKDVAERIGVAEAQIFAAQKMILEDERLNRQMLEAIEVRSCNAEAAVSSTFDLYETRFHKVANQYLNERASDIGEIKRRLLDVLRNMRPSLRCEGLAHCERGRNRIVVAEELTPALTLELNNELPAGFVTECGGTTSHAAILARALGVPAVSGVKGIHGLLSCGTELLINGDTGEVVVWPSEGTLSRIARARGAVSQAAQVIDAVAGLQVMASISRVSDVAEATYMKAEGIGLYRTEFEFLAAGRALEEAEQFERYAMVLKSMNGQPVSFRLLDMGGDKAPAFLDVPHEKNPYLGCRGARFLLDRPELLRTQARALARAAVHGAINVIYPMIVDLDQFIKLRSLFNEAIEGIATGPIRHGAMFEVPSACLQAREILQVADFGSIGSNDLIQYLFAVDRNSQAVAYDYAFDRPILWSLMGEIARAARETGRPLSVCGELAGDPENIPRLAALGIQAVSVSARLIPGVRQAAKQYLSAPIGHSEPATNF